MAVKKMNVTVRCGSRREWIDPLQAFSERIFTMAGFDDDEAYWPVLAVREAVMNAVLHGNKERPDTAVSVDYRLGDGRVEISVCDQGEGFDPGALGDPLSAENLLSEGGRGVYLMAPVHGRGELLVPGRWGHVYLVGEEPVCRKQRRLIARAISPRQYATNLRLRESRETPDSSSPPAPCGVSSHSAVRRFLPLPSCP